MQTPMSKGFLAAMLFEPDCISKSTSMEAVVLDAADCPRCKLHTVQLGEALYQEGDVTSAGHWIAFVTMQHDSRWIVAGTSSMSHPMLSNLPDELQLTASTSSQG